MKHLSTLVAVLVLVSLVGCATTTQRTASDDPFSNNLDALYAKRQHAQDWLLACALSLSLGVISGTVFSSLYSLGSIDQQTAAIGIISSYSLAAISTGWGTYQFFQFKNSFDDYLETLRLQTQYYNTLQPSRQNNTSGQ